MFSTTRPKVALCQIPSTVNRSPNCAKRTTVIWHSSFYDLLSVIIQATMGELHVMQYNLHISLPDNRGYIDSKEGQGTFTVAVMDIQKMPISRLTSDNFLLYCDGDFIDGAKVAEHIIGVYTIQFSIEEKYFPKANREDNP